jgi:hypothetical protein
MSLQGEPIGADATTVAAASRSTPSPSQAKSKVHRVRTRAVVLPVTSRTFSGTPVLAQRAVARRKSRLR